MKNHDQKCWLHGIIITKKTTASAYIKAGHIDTCDQMIESAQNTFLKKHT